MNLLFSLLFITVTDTTQITATDISNPEIVRILNNINFVKKVKTKKNFLRIMELANDPGSANGESFEATTNLYFALSNYGEIPDQKLYMLNNLYSPEIESTEENNKIFKIVVIYGAFDDRIRITLIMDMNSCKIEK